MVKTVLSGVSVASFVMAVPVLYPVAQMVFVKSHAMLSHVPSMSRQFLLTLTWRINQAGTVMGAARLK